MSLEQFPRHRPTWRCAIVCTLLTLLLFTCLPRGLEAAHEDEVPGLASPTIAGVIIANFVSETMGNRTRMIQVGCVFVAIGIFVLTRTYR